MVQSSVLLCPSLRMESTSRCCDDTRARTLRPRPLPLSAGVSVFCAPGATANNNSCLGLEPRGVGRPMYLIPPLVLNTTFGQMRAELRAHVTGPCGASSPAPLAPHCEAASTATMGRILCRSRTNLANSGYVLANFGEHPVRVGPKQTTCGFVRTTP